MVTGATLTRFFGLHVAVLPLLASGLLLAHLALIQSHGMSLPPSVMGMGRLAAKSSLVGSTPKAAKIVA